MSVQELARCVEFDTENDQQRDLQLKKQDYDRSLAQRELNAARDPLARLPFEISSEIFLQFRSGARRVSTVLLRICNAWTDIALATPGLWTTVSIGFPCGDGLAEILPIWFQRARNRPMSISITHRGPSNNWNHRVAAVLWRHGGQVKDFDMEISPEGCDFNNLAIDLFGDTTLVSLPLLETLAIDGPGRGPNYSGPQILELLRLTPNIVESVLDNVGPCHSSTSEKLVLPTLRQLVFASACDDDILHHLSLPALETLSLPMFSVSCEDLLTFVERSAPPLRDLTLGWEFYDSPNSIQLHECLHLIPSLAEFRMWASDSQVVTTLFAALADSPSLLPNLRNLKIHMVDSDISDSSWRTLHGVVSTRRLQLSISPVEVSPPADILAAFRELLNDGEEIFIGNNQYDNLAAYSS
ncbi:hypothetical protein B0H12DRAFT_430293 [Mycena haematopus]|nr:hypothetical protein B0H12DRAFT_430293 [Mycena haematopus]